MSVPNELLDLAVSLMQKHLNQINTTATYITKDGAKGFTTYDSQVIERYTKLLLAMTKQSGAEDDSMAELSDDELLEIINERQEHVQTSSSEE